MVLRRGFIRLAIALGVPYFGGWAMVGWFSYTSIDSYLGFAEKARERLDWPEVTHWMQLANESTRLTHLSAVWGIAVPAMATIFALVAYWVYRGFKPRTSE